jgi:hypothetical protein
MFNLRYTQVSRLICFVGLLLPAVTHAQTIASTTTECTPSPRDPAWGRKLFDEGLALYKKGQIDAACERLQESLNLDPMAGTALALADCRDAQLKTATAYYLLQRAADLASDQHDTGHKKKALNRLR